MRPFLTKLIALLFPRSPEEQALESLNSEAVSTLPRAATFCGITPIFRYKNKTVRDLLWLLKYKKSIRAAEIFTTVLEEYLLDQLAEQVLFEKDRPIVLAPIPARKKRMKKYGYNPPLLVLKKLALDRLGDNVSVSPRLLKKTCRTARQTELSRNERLQNMKESMEVRDRQIVQDAHVIVLDDVTTTGATLKEARRALKEAGTHSVTLVALGH